MKEVVKFLEENPTQYLATTSESGYPHVRPFQFMLEKGGKLYFCSSNKKDVYKEIKNNPNIELCVSTQKFEWIRISGCAVFSNDMDIKTAIVNKSPIVKKIYQTPDNPTLEIFYLENAQAVISDFSGNPPQKYSL